MTDADRLMLVVAQPDTATRAACRAAASERRVERMLPAHNRRASLTTEPRTAAKNLRVDPAIELVLWLLSAGSN